MRETAKLAKTLRQKAKASSAEDVLTRAEHQIITRSRRDILRLPAFGVLVLLLGEWLPLVVLYISPVIPEPCRIPKQVDRDLRKKEERRKQRLSAVGMLAGRYGHAGDRDREMNEVRSAAGMERIEVSKMGELGLRIFSARYGCHSWVWDYIGGPPTPLLRWAVGRKAERIRVDDRLIGRDGGWQALGKEEVFKVAGERGLDVRERSESDVRKEVGAWFR